jgi:hypothetical protein
MQSIKDYITEAMAQRSAFYLSRVQMPQINDVVSFKRFLDKMNVSHSEQSKQWDTLTPSQIDFDQEKVNKIKSSIEFSSMDPVIVAKTSSGSYILDGHHRYYALKQAGLDVPVLEVTIEPTDLLRLMYAYQNIQATTDDGTTVD